MAIEEQNSVIKFSSGRTAYANNLIVGIDPELNLSQGYDGGMYWPPWDDEDKYTLTKEDMKELADLMIARWTAFKATVSD